MTSSHSSKDRDSSPEQIISSASVSVTPIMIQQQPFVPFDAGKSDSLRHDVVAFPSGDRISPQSIILPRPLCTSAEANVSNFIAFHDSFVCPSHYIFFADFNRFCDRLLEFQEDCVPLRLAIAAYSAMLFSVYRRDRRARVLAFTYYTAALRSIQELIASASTESSIMGILAAVLELTSFEVRYYCS